MTQADFLKNPRILPIRVSGFADFNCVGNALSKSHEQLRQESSSYQNHGLGWAALLAWAGWVAKRFRREAPGQMAVPDQFRAADWMERVDVRALVPNGFTPKQWIADQVRNLNRGLRWLRFHADGANRCMSWSAALPRLRRSRVRRTT